MDSESHGIGRFMGHFDDKMDNGSIGRLTERVFNTRLLIFIAGNRKNRP